MSMSERRSTKVELANEWEWVREREVGEGKKRRGNKRFRITFKCSNNLS